MTLHLATYERFLLLSHLVDDVPDSNGGELVRLFSAACMATVRQLRGGCDETTARFAIDQARTALIAASRDTSEAHR